MRDLPNYWDDYFGAATSRPTNNPPASRARVGGTHAHLTTYPEVSTSIQGEEVARAAPGDGTGKKPLDYGMAEALAFASLVKHGIPVRLSGQDSRRATFNQRHSCCSILRTKPNSFPCATLRPTRQRATSSTRRFPKRASWIRIRLQPRLSRSSGSVGSAVRRFCERGAGGD